MPAWLSLPVEGSRERLQSLAYPFRCRRRCRMFQVKADPFARALSVPRDAVRMKISKCTGERQRLIASNAVMLGISAG